MSVLGFTPEVKCRDPKPWRIASACYTYTPFLQKVNWGWTSSTISIGLVTILTKWIQMVLIFWWSRILWWLLTFLLSLPFYFFPPWKFSWGYRYRRPVLLREKAAILHWFMALFQHLGQRHGELLNHLVWLSWVKCSSRGQEHTFSVWVTGS